VNSEFNPDRLIGAARKLHELSGVNVLPKPQPQILSQDQVTILKLCNHLEKLHAELGKCHISVRPEEVLRVRNIMAAAAKECEAALAMPVFK